jgi:hypothetical protein
MQDTPFEGHGAFHGYWTHDLGRVEKRFGDEAALTGLIQEARAQHMRVLLDLVVNHVGYTAPLVSEKPEFFHPPLTIENWDDATERVVRQVHGLPDLAQEKPEVRDFLVNHALSWLDRVGPDGYRVDAVRHIHPAFVEDLNRRVHRHMPGTTMLGEIFDGNPAAFAALSFGEAESFDQVFDFPLYYALVDHVCDDAPLARFASILATPYAPAASLVTFVDNHDLPRIASRCKDDPKRIRRALELQLRLRGVPSLTWGVEAGLSGKGEPQNRGDMVFDAEHPQKTLVRSLLHQRAQNPALRATVTRVERFDGEVFVWSRITHGQAAILALNTGEKNAVIQLPADLDRNSTVQALSPEYGVAPLGKEPMAVPAGGFATFLVSPEKGQTFADALEQTRKPVLRQVTFQLRLESGSPDCADCEYLVAGAGPLGDWQVEKAVGPFGKEAEWPRVSVRLPAGRVMAYKVVIRHPDGRVLWEKGPNRTLFFPPGKKPILVPLSPELPR